MKRSEPLLLVDDAIPFIKGVFEPYAEVIYADGKDFEGILHSKGCSASSDDTDNRETVALIIRTRTKCNASLLEGSAVKMIATATIGTDHIDLDYCKSHGIRVESAPGCNSGGVLQYVFTALYSIAEKKNINLDSKFTIGIIGVGHVGEKVAGLAKELGFKVILNDPPKEKLQRAASAYDTNSYSTLDYLLSNSDLVTMHVPLDETTKGMADSGFFSKMKNGSVFFNASRGAVVSDSELLAAIRSGKFKAVALDVWNNEPDLNRELLAAVDIATPHIAGYSFEGKVNGTIAAVRKCADFLGIAQLHSFVPSVCTGADAHPVKVDFMEMGQRERAEKLISIFPIEELSRKLKESPELFEQMRNNFNYRHEFEYPIR